MPSDGLGLVACGSKALLGTLLRQPVTRADLMPRGSGLARGLDLGRLQLLRRFSQAPGGFEPANRPVGGVKGTERGKQLPNLDGSGSAMHRCRLHDETLARAASFHDR
jgi:hypothetical protein